MQRGPKNLKEALFPHFTTYAIIGHGIFRNPSGQQRPVLSVIYAVILMFLYLGSLYWALMYMIGEPWYGQYDMILLYPVYVNVTIYIIGVFLSWYNAKRFARITENITKIDETLRDLGATFNYAKIRNEGYAVFVICMLVTLSFNWFDVLWIYDARPVSSIFLLFSVLHHPAHAMTIVGTNFCMEIRLIGARYKKINKILEGMKRRCCYDNSVTTLAPESRQFLRSSENRKYLLQTLKHMHLELGSISKDLCDSYGMQLALHLASLFVVFTGFLYLLFTLATSATMTRDHFRMVALGVWVVFYFTYFVLTNEVCERVSAEANRTGEIIHCICQQNSDLELVCEISQFSLQLIHEPLEFSPAGLITLNHVFVLRFVETVMTYLMIFIQMGPSKVGVNKHH